MGGDQEMVRFMKVLLIFMVSLLYCYFIASKLPKGKLRLLSLVPVFALFAVLPLYLSSAVLTGGIAFFVTWLTTFKLLLFSFDSGPLASDPPLSFPLFASIAFFPTRIKHRKTCLYDAHSCDIDDDPQELPPKLPINLPSKVFIFSLLLLLANDYFLVGLVTRPIVKLCINCGVLYFYLDMVMSLSNAFVRSTFGVEVKRPFDEPYLSTSLQKFWGRRWNLLVSETLHNAVYKPMRYEAGSPRWAAVIVVFAVSGLMHELLYYYILRVIPTWEATWFFVLHGMCVAVEIELKKMFGKKLQLHWAVSGPLTMAFVLITTHCFFFPPLLRMATNPRSTGPGV